MDCIGLIEKLNKNIIIKLHEMFLNENLDDSEYVKNIKAVLEGTEDFVRENKDSIEGLESLQPRCYQFAKELWLSELKKRIQSGSEDENSGKDESENGGYYEYYFDYIYAHDHYPK